MSYDSIEDYHFWTWVEAYPVNGWLNRVLVGLGFVPADLRDSHSRRAGR